MSLIQQELDDLYKEVNARQKKLKREATVRSVGAYILKGVAVLGSGLIASGLFSQQQESVDRIPQVIGILILIAVSIDNVFSNHKRLLVAKEAENALWALQKKVKHEFNGKVAPLYKRRKKCDESAEKAIDKLMSKAHKDLYTGIQVVQQKINTVDLEAFTSLSLDQKSDKGS